MRSKNSLCISLVLACLLSWTLEHFDDDLILDTMLRFLWRWCSSTEMVRSNFDYFNSVTVREMTLTSPSVGDVINWSNAPTTTQNLQYAITMTLAASKVYYLLGHLFQRLFSFLIHIRILSGVVNIGRRKLYVWFSIVYDCI